MMNFIKKLAAGLITLTLTVSTTFSSETKNNLQNFLNQWRIKNKVPGVILLINTPTSHNVFTSGTTVLNGKKPITLQTLFAVGSITKTFTSVMILKLEVEGKLNINESIGQYFPQYPRWKNVTIKQLLNMTSGIVNFTEDKAWVKNLESGSKQKWSKEKIIRLAYQKQDYFKPGDGWHYSNTEYLLLGEIIEKITGKSLENNFKIAFFQPLKLEHTYYNEERYPMSVINNMAHGYDNNHDMAVTLLANNINNIGPPGGAIVMSTIDLESWINHLLIKKDILPKKQLDEMLDGVSTPPNKLDLPNSKYGLGIGLAENKKIGKIISYAGTFPGYGSTFVWIPKQKILIIVQMNVNRHHDDDSSYLHFPSQSLIQRIIKENPI